MGDNDVYSAVVRDILTGYALGFVNSATVDPNTGVPFKDEASEHWWASAQAFGYLQPDHPTYYSQYAAYLQTISNAYGHPFSDRWQVVQASLDPATVGAMEIDVLPDTAASLAISSITRPSAGNVHLVCRGTPGTGFRIESSPDLSTGNWTALATVTADGTGSCSYDDDTATGKQRFYRAVYP